MSTAPHPTTSTSQPPKAAEGLEPVTPGQSATKPQPNGAPKEGGKDKAGKAKKDKKAAGGDASPLELNPPPGFFEARIKIYDDWKEKYTKWIAGR